MSNTFERRFSRALATTNDVMARSQRVMWCDISKIQKLEPRMALHRHSRA